MSEEALTAVGEAAGRVAGEALAVWRREHRRATLTELELAVLVLRDESFPPWMRRWGSSPVNSVPGCWKERCVWRRAG